jgi:site-specific DNA-methyltransferase (adenine-specific)
VAIEDAGWEIRDTVMWVYGSGFPKSLDVSKAIDKAAGEERVRLSRNPNSRENCDKSNTLYESGTVGKTDYITAPATDAARKWEGWGTALKPSFEPIIVARKPLAGTVVANVLRYGTGAINVDGCRVETEDVLSFGSRELGDGIKYGKCKPTTEGVQNPLGRWPANLIHDGSEEAVGLFPVTGASKAAHRGTGKGESNAYGVYGGESTVRGHDDNGGSAARFFYCAKASKQDRDEGLEGREASGDRPLGISQWEGQTNGSGKPMGPIKPSRNHHPTVKPTDLMRWLVRLVTPPGGLVWDPFMGSGSTGKAAMLEGFRFAGADLDPDHVEIARARIAHAARQGLLPFAA